MVRQTEITHIYNRLQELNEKIDCNTKLLNDILKLLNNDVKKKCDKMNEHIEFVENVYDAVKSPLNYICNSINSNTSLPSNDKLLEIKDDTKSDTNLDNDNDAN
jgi:tetrahydromethanopterin S-methyltransferase subunit G